MIRQITPLLAACLLLAGSSAAADTKRVNDELDNDSGAPVDLEWVEHSHAGNKLVHTLRAHEEWRARRLSGRNTIQIVFWRNFARGNNVKRVMAVYYNHKRLRAKMINVSDGGSKVVGSATVTRPDRHSVELTFPRWFIKRSDLNAYHWRVTVFSSAGLDHIPDRRKRILHRL